MFIINLKSLQTKFAFLSSRIGTTDSAADFLGMEILTPGFHLKTANMNIKPGALEWITVFLFQVPELAKMRLKTITGTTLVFLPRFTPAGNGICNTRPNIPLKRVILPPIHCNFTGNFTAGKWISPGDPQGLPQDGVLPFIFLICQTCV